MHYSITPFWLKCRASQNHLQPPCHPITLLPCHPVANTVISFMLTSCVYIRNLWLRCYSVSEVSLRTACTSSKKALIIWLLCHKCQWVTALAETQGTDAGHLGQGMRTEPWTHRLPVGHAVIWWWLITMLSSIDSACSCSFSKRESGG